MNPFATPDANVGSHDAKLSALSKVSFVLAVLGACLMIVAISFVIFAITFMGNGTQDPQSRVHEIVGSIFATGTGTAVLGFILGCVARRRTKNWANNTAFIVGLFLFALLALLLVGGIVELAMRGQHELMQ